MTYLKTGAPRQKIRSMSSINQIIEQPVLAARLGFGTQEALDLRISTLKDLRANSRITAKQYLNQRARLDRIRERYCLD